MPHRDGPRHRARSLDRPRILATAPNTVKPARSLLRWSIVPSASPRVSSSATYPSINPSHLRITHPFAADAEVVPSDAGAAPPPPAPTASDVPASSTAPPSSQEPRGWAATPQSPEFALSHEDGPGVFKPKRRWYGWQTLIADGLTGAAILAGLDRSDRTGDSIAVVGLIAFSLGTPIIHWAHGHVTKGAVSLAIRGGCAGALGLGTLNSGGAVSPLLLLGGLGLIAAIPIDAAIFAREDVPPRTATQTGFRVESLGFAPTLDPAVGGVGLSAIGRF
jgi:hypothetical protein